MSELVEVLGMVAGAVWISAALYFQMVCSKRIHPAHVAGLLLIGVALFLGSSAIVVRAPSTARMLLAASNALMLVIGIAAWVWIEWRADVHERQTECIEETEALEG